MLTNIKSGGIRCVEKQSECLGLPQLPEASGGFVTAISQFFPQKICIFRHSWSKFRVFKWLNNVLMRPQAPCYATDHKNKEDSTFAIVTVL